MIRRTLRENGRIISIVAATVIALACGTNYAYSAWAPQFAAKLLLSSTESNLIGTFGNLGMYASGLPSGMMVDARGPRWGVALGIVLFAAGYFPLQRAYLAGPESAPGVPVLCLFSFFTGAGSASAFTASIKTAALNYPLSRGTATAFPLAAFGLSAFVFSTIGMFGLRDDTSKLLLLLAAGTVSLPAASFVFLNVFPSDHYQSLPTQEHQALHRASSADSYKQNSTEEPGRQSHASTPFPTDSDEDLKDTTSDNNSPESSEEHEISSLLSSTSGPGDITPQRIQKADTNHDVRHVDIRGFALLPHAEFWQLFLMLGLLTGIGLMTINNIGSDAQALWKFYDNNVQDSYIRRRQNIHVCIISFGSFTGRLLSGIGSDMLVHRGRSRFWCLFVSASTFSAAQLCAITISDPYFLVIVSCLTGIAYGLLFGVFPSLVANTFGVNGLSTNWGTMTLAPVITGNIFNIIYGRIYDSHSIVNDKGQRECLEGLECYNAAYWITFFAGLAGVVVCGWTIWHENELHKNNEKGRRRSDHERLA